ncbi:MAG: hypothetical protein LLG00_04220, partial [Planctomycetaceae bacterium]|nr:hypothetical protein [Planctomycetaceae bacterium]
MKSRTAFVSRGTASLHHGDGSAANSTDQPATYVRLDKVTYPNGRQIGYNYAAGVDNIMSRLSSISDSVGNLAEYTYLGLSTIAKETRPQVS